MSENESVCLVVVDDDPGHRRLIEMNLRRAGLKNQIVGYENGADALDFMREHQKQPHPSPLLVLLDLNMPVMDGHQTLRILKSEESLRHIPVIILTTSDNPTEINRAYQSGCNVFVTKPVDYEGFADAINKLGLFVSVLKSPTTR